MVAFLHILEVLSLPFAPVRKKMNIKFHSKALNKMNIPVAVAYCKRKNAFTFKPE